MDVPPKEEVQKELGGEGWGERMWLSTEDYLHSLISLVNELVRILPFFIHHSTRVLMNSDSNAYSLD